MIRLEDAIIQKISNILKKNGVFKAAIFGSFARNEATDKSDIDILADLPEGKTILDLIEIKLQLEDALKIKVDIITYDSLNDKIREIVFREKVEIL